MSQTLEESPLREAAILTRAVENVFRKLIRLLMGRMSLTKLQEMIRIVFVEEAEEHLKKEKPGKNVALTKLALLTGLDTRTLNKIIDEKKNLQPHKEDKFLRNLTPECNVLDLWTNHKNYIDRQDSKPRILSLKGKSPSFESLMKEASSYRGVTAKSILENLESSESIEIDRNNQVVKLLNSRYLPFKQKGFAAALEVIFVTVGNLLDTLVHNTKSELPKNATFFQRSNWTTRLNPENRLRFRNIFKEFLISSENGAMEILEQYEEEEISSNQITAGISMFYFEDEASI